MPVVNREVVLPVDRERAWELITEPAELEGWLADEVEFEPEEGAPSASPATTASCARASSRRSTERRADRLPLGRLARRVGARGPDPGGTRFVVTEHRLADDGAALGPALMRAGARCAWPEPTRTSARVFAALADPTRRQVVRSLSGSRS